MKFVFYTLPSSSMPPNKFYLKTTVPVYENVYNTERKKEIMGRACSMHGIEEKYVPSTSGQAVTLLSSIPDISRLNLSLDTTILDISRLNLSLDTTILRSFSWISSVPL
jgi:hypothetical protein